MQAVSLAKAIRRFATGDLAALLVIKEVGDKVNDRGSLLIVHTVSQRASSEMERGGLL